MTTTRIETPWGVFRARFSEHGLARLEFPARPCRGKPRGRPGRTAGDVRVRAVGRSTPQNRWQQQTATALGRLLAGKEPRKLPPLDWSEGTGFQQRVWAALRRIPRGQTRTYAQIAAGIGRPKAGRAVGNACGANPLPVFVPCHRVVATGGGLGGFSGGLKWKLELLAQEGMLPGPNIRNLDAGLKLWPDTVNGRR